MSNIDDLLIAYLAAATDPTGDPFTQEERIKEAKLAIKSSITQYGDKRELDGRIDEHMSHILPATDKAHGYEQSGDGSGIQCFDNERLARLAELKKQRGELWARNASSISALRP